MRLDALLPWRAAAAEGRLPLLLIRHGQTAWNAERRFIGRTDRPLDAVGEEQARALAAALAPLPLRGVGSSPLARARQTAAPLAAARGLETAILPGLVELDQGALEGHPGSHLARHHPALLEAWRADPTAVRLPGGERYGDCRDRALATVSALWDARGAAGPPLALVSHKMVISALVCEALGLPLRMHHLVHQQNCAVNLLSLGADGLRVHRLNVGAEALRGAAGAAADPER